jgi:hypothetical protein
MAAILLDDVDLERLRHVLKGTTRPRGVRLGTWFNLTRSDWGIDELTIAELRALAESRPHVLTALGLPYP